MHRSFLMGVVFAASALAQEGADKERLVQQAMTKLRGSDYASVAWGGYHTAESKLRECVPEVRLQLAKLREASTDEARDAVRALLDALVQTDAVLTSEELAPFWRHEAALVLMSRDPAAHRASLRRAFHRQYDDPWAPWSAHIGWMGSWTDDEQIACGNLLAGLADPQLVRELLQAPVEVWVKVGDPGSRVEAEESLGAYMSARGRERVSDGFPPVARYSLKAGDAENGILVARGAPNVVARRCWKGDGWSCSASLSFEKYQASRIAWLVQVLGEGVRPQAESLTTPMGFAWQDAAAALAALDERRVAIERDLRAIAQVGVTAGLFPETEAKAWRPRIWFRWIDVRTDKTVPLPEANPKPK